MNAVRTILANAARTAFTLSLIPASFLAVQHFTPIHMDVVPSDPVEQTVPRAERLMMRHDCWNGEAPADVDFPGHVVVARPGEGARLGGPRLVGQALDQIFSGVDNDLTVHGFCR